MAKQDLPTPEELRKLLRYDPETGKLFWRERTPDMFNATPSRSAEATCTQWNSRSAGKEAFTADNGQGYKTGKIFDKPYRAHRVIWAIYYNKWPTHEIDHTNGVRDDNRISELRDVTRKENGRNTATYSTNTSGHVGVYWKKSSQKWCAHIKSEDRIIHLGLFSDIGDAIAARKAAEVKYGFHPNHGRN